MASYFFMFLTISITSLIKSTNIFIDVNTIIVVSKIPFRTVDDLDKGAQYGIAISFKIRLQAFVLSAHFIIEMPVPSSFTPYKKEPGIFLAT